MCWFGKGYIVWDKFVSIDFIWSGKGMVCVYFELMDECVDEIKCLIVNGDKYLFEWDIDIFDEDGELVVWVYKVLYVCKKW